jgi:hypothetical protein
MKSPAFSEKPGFSNKGKLTFCSNTLEAPDLSLEGDTRSLPRQVS